MNSFCLPPHDSYHTTFGWVSSSHSRMHGCSISTMATTAIKQCDPILPSFTSLAQTTGLAYIPLYACTCSPKCASQPMAKSSCPLFTEEHARFAKMYEEGYDLVSDTRYNQWLDCYHPQQSVCETETPPRVSQLGSVVRKYMPHHPQARASLSIKSGKVLTSAECMQALAEKEREKQLKIEEKEEKKTRRESC